MQTSQIPLDPLPTPAEIIEILSKDFAPDGCFANSQIWRHNDASLAVTATSSEITWRVREHGASARSGNTVIDSGIHHAIAYLRALILEVKTGHK